MKNLKRVLPISLFFAFVLSPLTFALDFSSGFQAGIDFARGKGVPDKLFGFNGTFSGIINFMLFAVGILSVIMLIFGGLRYVISGGNDKKVEAAKNTILYAIVGLIVAIMAYAIVNFVVKSFIPNSGVGSSPVIIQDGGTAGGGAPTDV